MEFPIDADGYIRCDRAISLGYDRHSLSRAARAGELTEIAPGIYALPQ